MNRIPTVVARTRPSAAASCAGPSGSPVVFSQPGESGQRNGAWGSANVDLSAYAGQTVQLQVEAADASKASLLEAGVDDVVVTRQ
jgi:bacillopeptidase F (M6 metalloprotease family)